MTVQKSHFQIVRDLLVQKIAEGALPDGTRLYVAALADRLTISRSPVKRALDLLAQDGIVARDGLRGYIVGKSAAPDTPRPNLHMLDLTLPGKDSAAIIAPSWEMILAKVEATLLDTIPFGIFQISEAGLCDHFAVSRTVTREVLARLHDRGTITKDRASHWIAGPLSARMLDDLHDIRRIVEPAALERTAPMLEAQDLGRMRARVDAAQGTVMEETAMDQIEADLHDHCLAPLRNQRLAQTVRRAQLSSVVNRLFARYIARHDETAMLLEHRLVLDHLVIRDARGAAVSLQHHLDADHQRTRDRLKVLGVFGDPHIVPYLTRLV